MKNIVISLLLTVSAFMVFGQNNVNVVAYKILEIPRMEETKFTVPDGVTWKIEGIVARKPSKVWLKINGISYLFFWGRDVGFAGPENGVLPFYLPENTVFTVQTEENTAISIAALKIE